MMNVMIVEDEKIIRLSLRKVIETEAVHDFRIAGEARDGLAALELLPQISPHIVVTDIKMPAMDGLRFTEEINKRAHKPEVVILSGYDDFAYAKQAMRLGVADYLLKPVDPAELIETLQRIRTRIVRAEGLVSNQIQWMRLQKNRAQQLIDAIATLNGGKVRREVRLFYELASNHAAAHVSMKESFDTFVALLMEEQRQTREAYGLPPIVQLAFTHDGERNVEILERHLLSIIEAAGARRSAAGLIVKRAIDFIERNYATVSLQLQDVADNLGISGSYLSRTFKAETNTNFINYLTEYRLKKAKQLMGDPDAKLHAISSSIGYEEYAHFSRTFKKHYGVSPADYRRMAGNRETVG